MSALRKFPARPSLDSLRKQARRLARDAAAAIHSENYERLKRLLEENPTLVLWRGNGNQSLLDETTSYAMHCSEPERERTYTRPVAADMLIDAGAVVEKKMWMHVIRTGASGMLRMLERKNALPHTLAVMAALGDDRLTQQITTLPETNAGGVADANDVTEAFLIACRFKHTNIALALLGILIAFDAEFGNRIDRWKNRLAFVSFLEHQPGLLWRNPQLNAWQTFVVLQLDRARDQNDLPAFTRWLDYEGWILTDAFAEVQSALILPACYQKDRAAFIEAVFERNAALLHTDKPPHSSHIVQALSYGNASLVPLLTRVWPLPNDLPHAAGIGDMEGVERWFDAAGRVELGALANHYPASDPQFPRADLHWGPPTEQQTLDIALAWAALNKHFTIAEFLLARGSDINTDWGTHEPASILHEAAIQGNEDAVQFLIQHGVDVTMTDFRYQSTAEGWARYGSNDAHMADVLAKARQR